MLKHLILIILLFIIGCSKTDESMEKLDKIATGLNFAEGPAWSSTGILYVSNCYGNWIAQIKQNRLDTFVVKPTPTGYF